MNDISQKEKYATPNDLGEDQLSKFLESAHYNTIATYSNLRPHYKLLAGIDNLYYCLLENNNKTPELVSCLLLFRTHSSFRGAVHLCLAGQIPEAYMVLRGSLESALYGFYMNRNISLQETWLRRHDDNECRIRVRKEFKINNILRKLHSIDDKIHDIAKSLYNWTIDYGAHPNERVVTSQIKVDTADTCHHINFNYFLCGNISHLASLKSTAQIGICCLDIYSHVFPDQFQNLGINNQLDLMRQGL